MRGDAVAWTVVGIGGKGDGAGGLKRAGGSFRIRGTGSRAGCAGYRSSRVHDGGAHTGRRRHPGCLHDRRRVPSPRPAHPLPRWRADGRGLDRGGTEPRVRRAGPTSAQMGGKAVEVIYMDACPSPAQGRGGVLFGKGFDGDCGEHTAADLSGLPASCAQGSGIGMADSRGAGREERRAGRWPHCRIVTPVVSTRRPRHARFRA